MPTSPVSSMIEQIRRPSDGELLGRFVEHRDEIALAALVKVHGPMVWGVCRRLLSHHDAEDAFQAAFIVLVRKAASITPREMVGNWLYGVVCQAAVQARSAARRRGREIQVVQMPDTEAPQDEWAEVRAVLDEELSRLPDHYRAVIVLCDLEGRSRREVAAHLGCPEGTVASRLARARAMLAKRLTQRSIALSGGALAAAQQAVSAGVPNSVVNSTIKAATRVAVGKAATGAISAKVAALTEGVVQAMFLTKLKVTTAVVFLIAVVGLAAWASRSTVATDTPLEVNQAKNETTPPSRKQANAKQLEKARKEPDLLTPEEVIKQRPKEKVAMLFKTASVEVTPLDGPKIEGYDEGPFIRLKDGGKFSVLLRGPASYQIMRLGIEPDKHFSGKVVRVTGLVQPDLPDAGGPPFNIVVDDLTQFEVVKE